ncbi:ribonuclease H-like domain-containing protein [Tanacetum coccineum]
MDHMISLLVHLMCVATRALTTREHRSASGDREHVDIAYSVECIKSMHLGLKGICLQTRGDKSKSNNVSRRKDTKTTQLDCRSMDNVDAVSVNGITKLNNDGRAPIAAAKTTIKENSPFRVRHVTMDPIVDVYEFQAELQVSNVDVTCKDGQTPYVAASVGIIDARPKVDVGDVTILIEKVDAGAGAKLVDGFESVTSPHARTTLHRAEIRTDTEGNNRNDAASFVCVAGKQMGETQQVNDNVTPIKDTSHMAADREVFLDNFAGIKPNNGADTNGGSNVDDAALHQAWSDEKHAHGSPYNTGVKLFANLFNTDCSSKNLSFHVVQNYVTNTWAKFGFENLMKTDGVYLFKFAAKTGMDQSALKKDEVTKIPVWVKMHKVPVVAYSKDDLSLIATQIRKSLMLDAFTCSMCEDPWGRISFTRALIEICSVSDLKREVSMAVPNEDGIGHTREVIKVEYKWQPPRCTDCKVFCHSHDKCLKRVNLETPSENKDPVIPSNVSTHSDGFTEVRRKKNKGIKGTNVKGANMDNSNKVNTPSTSNSFDDLNNMEEGTSSSRNIQEDDPEAGNTSQ